MSDFQAVILAGGRGERLRPLTDSVPKPLVAVAGQPYLNWQIRALVDQNIRKILILTGYLGHAIEATLGTGSQFGAHISYSHEPAPLGTGGALVRARPWLDSEFILLNGDSFLSLDFAAFMKGFRQSGSALMVAAYDNRVPTQVPENLLVKDGLVQGYEKGAGRARGFDYVDAGIYAFQKSALEYLNPAPDAVQNLELLWNGLIRNQQVSAYSVPNRFYDIGTLSRLREFEDALPSLFPNQEV